MHRLHKHWERLATRPEAIFVLAFVAFGASICLPIPPDPLLALMALQNLRRIPMLVSVCSLSSALGGLAMYGIGYSLYETWGRGILDFYQWNQAFQSIQNQLHHWGFGLLILKAFTPIPYKLIALSYGVGHFDLGFFFLGSLLGRAGRFSLEGLLLWRFGPFVRERIEHLIKPALWVFGSLVCTGFIFLIFL